MLRFDPVSIREWHRKSITDISCATTDRGCAGKKIQVFEYRDPTFDTPMSIGENITCWVKDQEKGLFENAYITYTKGKWIISSSEINTRCGCGSSFSVKSGNAIEDKIARMKLAMKEKKEGIHT